MNGCSQSTAGQEGAYLFLSLILRGSRVEVMYDASGGVEDHRRALRRYARDKGRI